MLAKIFLRNDDFVGDTEFSEAPMTGDTIAYKDQEYKVEERVWRLPASQQGVVEFPLFLFVRKVHQAQRLLKNLDLPA